MQPMRVEFRYARPFERGSGSGNATAQGLIVRAIDTEGNVFEKNWPMQAEPGAAMDTDPVRIDPRPISTAVRYIYGLRGTCLASSGRVSQSSFSSHQM